MNFTYITNKLQSRLEAWEPRFQQLSNSIISQHRNGQNRTIKQILGHLIDSASNNHQRFIRLQYSSCLLFPDYRQDNDLWIALQDYQNADWNTIVQLWKFYNLHLIQVIKSVDSSKLNNVWYDFEGTKVSLQEMIEGYLPHLDLHLDEIEELINNNQV